MAAASGQPCPRMRKWPLFFSTSVVPPSSLRRALAACTRCSRVPWGISRPVIKPPIWKPEIPWYLFSGGLGGGSAGLAYLAGRTGNDVLARRAWAAAMAGVGASPLLLIKDLGKPQRFFNMLRVFKVTSPMNLGAWLLMANGGATTLAAGLSLSDDRRRGGAPEVAAAALGAPLATYTAVLIANSAIPAWSEARGQLPFVFAASE